METGNRRCPTVEGAKVVCEGRPLVKRRQSTLYSTKREEKVRKPKRSPPAVYRVNRLKRYCLII